MASGQPSTPPPTAEFCVQRAASLLKEAEKTSDRGASRAVEIAAGWRDLGVAISQITSAGNA